MRPPGLWPPRGWRRVRQHAATRRVGAGGALSAFGVAVAGDEAFVAVVGDAFFDPGHGCLPRDMKIVISAQCPQTLPRMTAEVSERSRKLNVPLTCYFTLTLPWSRGECEPLGEAVGEVVRHLSLIHI